MEMTATAILWRVGSSWLLSRLMTIMAAEYLNHEWIRRTRGEQADLARMQALQGQSICFLIDALEASAFYNRVKTNGLVKRNILKDVVTAERQQTVLLHLK